MSCYGWAWVSMGRCLWLWSGHGYKLEGKCWALLSTSRRNCCNKERERRLLTKFIDTDVGRLHGCAFQFCKPFLLHSPLGTPRPPSTRPQCTPPSRTAPCNSFLRSLVISYASLIYLFLCTSLSNNRISTNSFPGFHHPNPSQVYTVVLYSITLDLLKELLAARELSLCFFRKDIFAESTMASMTTLASLPAVHTGLRTDVEKSFGSSSSSSQSLLAQRSAVTKSSRSVVARASHGQEEGQVWKVAKSAAAAAAIALVLNASPAQAADPNAFLSFPDNAAGEAVSLSPDPMVI